MILLFVGRTRRMAECEPNSVAVPQSKVESIEIVYQKKKPKSNHKGSI